MAANKNYAYAAGAPVGGGVAVTPSNTEDLAQMSRILWVGTAGDLKVTLDDNSVLVYKNAQGWMPMRATRIWATGTTAADIVSH